MNITNSGKITLSDEQEAATVLIFEYLGATRMRPAVLHGLAGTGKTTVLSEVARDVPQAILFLSPARRPRCCAARPG